MKATFSYCLLVDVDIPDEFEGRQLSGLDAGDMLAELGKKAFVDNKIPDDAGMEITGVYYYPTGTDAKSDPCAQEVLWEN